MDDPLLHPNKITFDLAPNEHMKRLLLYLGVKLASMSVLSLSISNDFCRTNLDRRLFAMSSLLSNILRGFFSRTSEFSDLDETICWCSFPGIPPPRNVVVENVVATSFFVASAEVVSDSSSSSSAASNFKLSDFRNSGGFSWKFVNFSNKKRSKYLFSNLPKTFFWLKFI